MPFQECYVVRQSLVKGESEREYFEVCADGGYIVQIKYLSPILREGSTSEIPSSIKKTWGDDAELRHYPDSYVYHLQNMILAAQLLFPADETTISSLVKTLAMLRLYRVKCGNGMTHYEFKDRVMLGRTTFTGDAVELLVVGESKTRAGSR